MGGPGWKASLLTGFFILAPTVLFLYFVAFQIYEFNVGPGVAGAVLLFLSLFFLFITAFSDPGIIPRQEPDSEGRQGLKPSTRDVIVNGHKVSIRYNATCNFYQPPRAHHCSVNDNCIERFDHHCPWIGTTIGLRNYRSFLLFIHTSTFLCLFVVAFCSYFAVTRARQYVAEYEQQNNGQRPQPHSILRHKNIPWAMAMFLFAGISFLFVGCLTFFHLWLIAKNQTTYENFRYASQKRDNPYDRGLLYNCREVWFATIPKSRVNARRYRGDIEKPKTDLPINMYLREPYSDYETKILYKQTGLKKQSSVNGVDSALNSKQSETQNMIPPNKQQVEKQNSSVHGDQNSQSQDLDKQNKQKPQQNDSNGHKIQYANQKGIGQIATDTSSSARDSRRVDSRGRTYLDGMGGRRSELPSAMSLNTGDSSDSSPRILQMASGNQRKSHDRQEAYRIGQQKGDQNNKRDRRGRERERDRGKDQKNPRKRPIVDEAHSNSSYRESKKLLGSERSMDSSSRQFRMSDQASALLQREAGHGGEIRKQILHTGESTDKARDQVRQDYMNEVQDRNIKQQGNQQHKASPQKNFQRQISGDQDRGIRRQGSARPSQDHLNFDQFSEQSAKRSNLIGSDRTLGDKQPSQVPSDRTSNVSRNLIEFDTHSNKSPDRSPQRQRSNANDLVSEASLQKTHPELIQQIEFVRQISGLQAPNNNRSYEGLIRNASGGWQRVAGGSSGKRVTQISGRPSNETSTGAGGQDSIPDQSPVEYVPSNERQLQIDPSMMKQPIISPKKSMGTESRHTKASSRSPKIRRYDTQESSLDDEYRKQTRLQQIKKITDDRSSQGSHKRENKKSSPRRHRDRAPRDYKERVGDVQPGGIDGLIAAEFEFPAKDSQILAGPKQRNMSPSFRSIGDEQHFKHGLSDYITTVHAQFDTTNNSRSGYSVPSDKGRQQDSLQGHHSGNMEDTQQDRKQRVKKLTEEMQSVNHRASLEQMQKRAQQQKKMQDLYLDGEEVIPAGGYQINIVKSLQDRSSESSLASATQLQNRSEVITPKKSNTSQPSKKSRNFDNTSNKSRGFDNTSNKQPPKSPKSIFDPSPQEFAMYDDRGSSIAKMSFQPSPGGQTPTQMPELDPHLLFTSGGAEELINKNKSPSPQNQQNIPSFDLQGMLQKRGLDVQVMRGQQSVEGQSNGHQKSVGGNSRRGRSKSPTSKSREKTSSPTPTSKGSSKQRRKYVTVENSKNSASNKQSPTLSQALSQHSSQQPLSHQNQGSVKSSIRQQGSPQFQDRHSSKRQLEPSLQPQFQEQQQQMLQKQLQQAYEGRMDSHDSYMAGQNQFFKQPSSSFKPQSIQSGKTLQKDNSLAQSALESQESSYEIAQVQNLIRKNREVSLSPDQFRELNQYDEMISDLSKFTPVDNGNNINLNQQPRPKPPQRLKQSGNKLEQISELDSPNARGIPKFDYDFQTEDDESYFNSQNGNNNRSTSNDVSSAIQNMQSSTDVDQLSGSVKLPRQLSGSNVGRPTPRLQVGDQQPPGINMQGDQIQIKQASQAKSSYSDRSKYNNSSQGTSVKSNPKKKYYNQNNLNQDGLPPGVKINGDQIQINSSTQLSFRDQLKQESGSYKSPTMTSKKQDIQQIGQAMSDNKNLQEEKQEQNIPRQGSTVTFKYMSTNSMDMNNILAADDLPGRQRIDREKLAPQNSFGGRNSVYSQGNSIANNNFEVYSQESSIWADMVQAKKEGQLDNSKILSSQNEVLSQKMSKLSQIKEGSKSRSHHDSVNLSTLDSMYRDPSSNDKIHQNNYNTSLQSASEILPPPNNMPTVFIQPQSPPSKARSSKSGPKQVPQLTMDQLKQLNQKTSQEQDKDSIELFNFKKQPKNQIDEMPSPDLIQNKGGYQEGESELISSSTHKQAPSRNRVNTQQLLQMAQQQGLKIQQSYHQQQQMLQQQMQHQQQQYIKEQQYIKQQKKQQQQQLQQQKQQQMYLQQQKQFQEQRQQYDQRQQPQQQMQWQIQRGQQSSSSPPRSASHPLSQVTQFHSVRDNSSNLQEKQVHLNTESTQKKSGSLEEQQKQPQLSSNEQSNKVKSRGQDIYSINYKIENSSGQAPSNKEVRSMTSSDNVQQLTMQNLAALKSLESDEGGSPKYLNKQKTNQLPNQQYANLLREQHMKIAQQYGALNQSDSDNGNQKFSFTDDLGVNNENIDKRNIQVRKISQNPQQKLGQKGLYK